MNVCGRLLASAPSRSLAARPCAPTIDHADADRSTSSPSERALRPWWTASGRRVGDALRAGLVVLPDGAPLPREDPRLDASCARRTRFPTNAASPPARRRSPSRRTEAGASFAFSSPEGASSLALVAGPGVTLEVARDVIRALLLTGADVAKHQRRAASSLASFTAADCFARRRPADPHVHRERRDRAASALRRRLGPVGTRSNDGRGSPRRLPRYAPVLRAPAARRDAEARRRARARNHRPRARAAGRGAGSRASRPGRRSRCFRHPSTTSRRSAREYVRLARTMKPGEAVVRVAEPSLRITGARPGAGGDARTSRRWSRRSSLPAFGSSRQHRTE